MKELVLVESVPAKLTFNLDEYRKSIREELKEYDLVVTVDTVKGAKDLAANLNKAVKSLKDDFKTAAKVVTDPVDQISLQVSEIVSEILESREKLTIQIKKFEDEQKVIIFDLLNDSLISEWKKQGVHTEFCQVKDLSSLIKLGSITKGGKLTSAAAQSIITMVAQDKAMQDQTEKRLLMLENQSYKSGLKAPLTRAHVESFLFSDEEKYHVSLDRMIESEINRQEVAEQAMRATIEKEQTMVEPVATEPVNDISSYVSNTSDNLVSVEDIEEATSHLQQHVDRVNSNTGRALMEIGLTKPQAVEIMEKAYNGELHGLRMVY